MNGSAGKDAASPKSGEQKAEKAARAGPRELQRRKTQHRRTRNRGHQRLQQTGSVKNAGSAPNSDSAAPVQGPAQQKEPTQKDSVQNEQDAKAAPQKPARTGT